MFKKSSILLFVLLMVGLVLFTGCDNDILEDEIKTIPVTMVEVPKGTTASNNGNLTLAYDIYMRKYPITNAEYVVFLNDAGILADGSYEETEFINMTISPVQIGHNGNEFYLKDWTDPFGTSTDIGDYPVINVTWYGALAYCNWLSAQEGLTSAYNLDNWELIGEPEELEGYRLPEADEWEYAARGGVNGNATTYAGSDDLDNVGWHRDNSAVAGSSNLEEERGTHEVGLKQANELGIYDMSGNVWEWTNTFYGEYLIVQGGSWYVNASTCTVNTRYSFSPFNFSSDVGFRLIRSI